MPEILKSELEEGKCAKKVQPNGLKLPGKEICAGRLVTGEEQGQWISELTLIEGKIGKEGKVSP